MGGEDEVFPSFNGSCMTGLQITHNMRRNVIAHIYPHVN